MIQKRLKMKRYRAKARGQMKRYSAERMSGGFQFLTPGYVVVQELSYSLSNGSISQTD